MNGALKAVISFMLNKKYIGARHTPEEKLIISKTKWLQKEDYRDFKKECKSLINDQIIIRVKKKTGKGSDWHISLNPRKLKELARDDWNE